MNNSTSVEPRPIPPLPATPKVPDTPKVPAPTVPATPKVPDTPKRPTHGSRLPAIILFALVAFFASGVRAQTVVEVDNNDATHRLSKTETAVAVRLWKDNTDKDDGNTSVAAFIYGSLVATSITTNGGSSWTQQTTISAPGAITSADQVDDEKLAYRLDGSGNPELVAAFRCYDADGSEGTFVTFSSDDGNSWETTQTKTVALNSSWTDATRTSRPCIATDNNSGSTHRNYAYVAWTQRGTGASNICYVGRFTSGSPHTLSSVTSIAVGGTNLEVDVDDIAVSANGHVFVLWRETNTGVTPNTRNLFLSESTDGGGTWPTVGSTYTSVPSVLTYPILTGSKIPSETIGGPDGYDDPPCLAISKSSCGAEKAFVAYTELPSNPTQDGPSDLFYTSAAMTDLTTWSTKFHVDADNQIPATNAFSFQFEPAISPDANGGVFILYYSQQISGTPISASPVLYESDLYNTQVVLGPPVSTGLLSVNDYVGIAWNPILQVAQPVWTGHDGTYDVSGIYSTSGFSGTSSNPAVALGDLGFSNQRRAVMTGSTGHLAGFGELTPSSTINKKNAVWYSEGTTDPCNSAATAWTDPLELDTHDFDQYTSTSGPSYNVADANGTEPSLGTYERGGTSAQKGQRAIAAVWTANAPNSAGYATDQVYLYIRVKEYDVANGEAGGLSAWSAVDSIAITPGSVVDASSPVVAPLTVPVSGSKERYLIGWIVTYSQYAVLQSVTYLRGLTAGTEGSNPATKVETENESWGPHKGTWSAVSTIVDDNSAPDPYYRLTGSGTHGSFISVTSNESNGNGTGNPLDLSEEVVFTGDGTLPYSQVWDVNPSYITVRGATLGALGTNLGEAVGSVPGGPYAPYLATWLSDGNYSNPPGGVTRGGDVSAAYQRNPSVTITSTGQKIASWEEIATYWDWTTPYTYSWIVSRKTQGDGTWNPIFDLTTETANDLTWTWLRNPSVTAFPKTTLHDDLTASLDKDPGAAELLYWVQNELSGATKMETDYNLEEQFNEKRGIPWGGSWYSPLANWYPINPLTNNNYVGVNTQRSFGIYNAGPQFNIFGLLKTSSGAPYVHGLSYGIANSVTGGTPQPQLSSPTPDIGALKGTYDTALGVQFYSSETRRSGSSSVTFKWGKVYVGDTSIGQPFREVMLHNGIPDSNIYASHDAMRDSIFQTEWFDWPVSAEIKYNRLMLIPSAGTITYTIDTTLYYDSVGGSHIVYDTVPNNFVADSTRRTDSAFFAPATHMSYTIQLVHQDGHIDTMERANYNPSVGTFIIPKTVHIDNAGYAGDTVMLRVIGNFNNVPDADSDVSFARETMLDTYPSFGDTTLAIGTGGGVVPPPDTCFAADGPYSNPSNPGSDDVSILVHYCASGSTITAQVYTSGGTPVGSPSTYTSDGQIWDRLPITAPGTSGTYYITVSVGSYFTTLGYSVY